jgi:hypothetical protein
LTKGPLKLRELLKRLKPYGIKVMAKKRGKGSGKILLLPSEENPKKGPQYPIKDHGPATEIALPVISAILRRFGITDFWEPDKKK